MRIVILGLTFFAGLAIAQQPPAPPPALRVPDGQKLLFKAHGTGTQIYTCKAGNGGPAWTLKAPDAQLFDSSGKLVAKHFAGPTWQATDGSSVQGKAVANAPAPGGNAIPWLLLSATSHTGTGVMTRVESIQRLNTAGGKAPASGCDATHAGSDVSIHYDADYYFYSGVGQ